MAKQANSGRQQPPSQPKDNHMKTVTKFFLAATFTAASLSQAADLVAPPRTLEHIKSVAKVGSAADDKLDRSVKLLAGRAGAHADSLAKSGGAAEDKIVRTGLAGSPRDRVTFELAPLK